MNPAATSPKNSAMNGVRTTNQAMGLLAETASSSNTGLNMPKNKKARTTAQTAVYATATKNKVWGTE